MERALLQQRRIPPISRRIPAIHSKRGILPSRLTICLSNTSRSAGSTTTAMRACRIGQAAEELRPLGEIIAHLRITFAARARPLGKRALVLRRRVARQLRGFPDLQR